MSRQNLTSASVTSYLHLSGSHTTEDQRGSLAEQITRAAMLVCPFDGALQRDTASTGGGSTQLVSAT